MSTHELREQTIAVDGIEIHVAIAGEPANPGLLLLHGLYDRWDTWEPVIYALSGQFHVVAPDLRGHARSSRPETGYAFQDYVGDLIGLIDALQIAQIVPVGHSLGALIGEYLAADHPDRASGLVLIDPPFEQNQQTRQWLEILLEAKRGTLEETYETVRELNILTGDEAEWRRQADWLHATADGPFEAMIQMIDTGSSAELYEVLGLVHCPTLLLQADPRSGGALSDSGAARAMEHLDGAEHQKFHHTGHSIHLERTGEFVQAVTRFLIPPG